MGDSYIYRGTFYIEVFVNGRANVYAIDCTTLLYEAFNEDAAIAWCDQRI